MTESTQLIRIPQRPRAALSAPMEVPVAALRLKPKIRMTRAHLALQQRAEFVARAKAAVAAAFARLSECTETSFSAQATLLDGTVHAANSLTKQSAFVLFDLAPLQQHAVLEIERTLLGSLLQKVAGSSPEQPGPTQLTRIEEAALGWLLLNLIQTLRCHPAIEQHFSPRLMSVHVDRGEVLQQIGIKEKYAVIALNLSNHQQARLLIPSVALQTAVEREASEVNALPLTESVLEARFETAVRVGRAALSKQDVVSLLVGDVVLFEGARRERGTISGFTRLYHRQFSFLGQLSAEGFTLNPESPMSHAETQLEVSVELCRLKLSIRELAEIQAGRVLPLCINGASPVVLRLGDRAVAKAELVDVEGELGARIIHLTAPREEK
jgi:type III secretion protein Q